MCSYHPVIVLQKEMNPFGKRPLVDNLLRIVCLHCFTMECGRCTKWSEIFDLGHTHTFQLMDGVHCKFFSPLSYYFLLSANWDIKGRGRGTKSPCLHNAFRHSLITKGSFSNGSLSSAMRWKKNPESNVQLKVCGVEHYFSDGDTGISTTLLGHASFFLSLTFQLLAHCTQRLG